LFVSDCYTFKEPELIQMFLGLLLTLALTSTLLPAFYVSILLGILIKKHLFLHLTLFPFMLSLVRSWR